MDFAKLGIGGTNPCFIIAEIGQNHQGDVRLAKSMIRQAKECGANCVKFQKSSLSHRFTKVRLESPYDSKNSFGKTYGEHRNALEFSQKDFLELQHFASKSEIMFSSSCMDIPSADLLIAMKIPFIKIGSGDTNNYPLIEHVAKAMIPIILSTGMQEMSTVRRAKDIIFRYHKNLVILHCVSSYPTKPEDINLRIINLYRDEFPEVIIGYSGHEIGINAAMAAVALGAKVIEKHFTMDKNLKGTDHQCSMEPADLINLVKGIREVETSLGFPIKKILPCEEPCRLKLGKSVVSARKLYIGQVLRDCDLAVKVSDPMGLRPELIDRLIGSITEDEIEEDVPLSLTTNGVAISTLNEIHFS